MKKERYNVNFDAAKCEYNGRMYFLHFQIFKHVYVCSSDLTGNDIRILAKGDSGFSTHFLSAHIHVNETGIYLYDTLDRQRLWVNHYWFDGSLLAKYHKNYRGDGDGTVQVRDLYFYGNKLYFVYIHHDREICTINCMYIDANRIETIYKKADNVYRLYATEDKLFFQADYNNDRYDVGILGAWMIYDLMRDTTESLSHPYYNPEMILKTPTVYCVDHKRYDEKCYKRRDITFLDLDKSIFWTKRPVDPNCSYASVGTMEYWEPHELWGDRDAVTNKMPVWKMVSTGGRYLDREYFDGVYHYYTDHYTKFMSTNMEGEVFCWQPPGNLHGECNFFVVDGNYLYINMDTRAEEQYSLSICKQEPLRKTWFKEDWSQKEIELYSSKNQEQEAKEETKQNWVFEVVDLEDDSDIQYDVLELEDNTLLPWEYDLHTTKEIGTTDVKYNILTLGAKFHIGFGSPVTIQMDHHSYQVKMHNSVKGRIDGLKQFYQDHNLELGSKLEIGYSRQKNLIFIEKLGL